MRRLSACFRQFGHDLAQDRRGTALIEFAVAFPVLLTLYLGAFTYSDAVACKRKVTITARALGDLGSRYSSLTTSEVTTILNAGATIMYPYQSTNAAMVLSEVKVTDATHAQVVWSKAANGTALVKDAIITIPAGTAATGTFLIRSQVTYTYTPAVAFDGIGAMQFSDTMLMLPRISEEIPLS